MTAPCAVIDVSRNDASTCCQVGIAVGAIDDGGEACFQRHGRTSRVDLELRRVRRPLNFDAVEGTVELARRAQYPCKPLNRVEIRVGERIFSRDGSARRMSDVPGTECT